jgi:hypothetical protein
VATAAYGLLRFFFFKAEPVDPLFPRSPHASRGWAAWVAKASAHDSTTRRTDILVMAADQPQRTVTVEPLTTFIGSDCLGHTSP